MNTYLKNEKPAPGEAEFLAVRNGRHLAKRHAEKSNGKWVIVEASSKLLKMARANIIPTYILNEDGDIHSRL